MKLRFFDNSIRVRLSQPEVAKLAQGGSVEDMIEFGDASLAYVVAAGPELSARFEDRRITITIPEAEAKLWAASDRTGIEGSRGRLNIAVEKDFQCLHGPERENAGAFPNPLAKSRGTNVSTPGSKRGPD